MSVGVGIDSVPGFWCAKIIWMIYTDNGESSAACHFENPIIMQVRNTEEKVEEPIESSESF